MLISSRCEYLQGEDSFGYILLSITNKIHVSGGFSAHHQALKNCTHKFWYMPSLLAAIASMGGTHPR